jgi:MFS family permease
VTTLPNPLRRIGRFHRNVYLVFISSFIFGFILFGGLYQVLVNLFLIRMGYGTEFIGLVNGLCLLFLSLGSLCASVLGLRFSGLSLLRFGFVFFFVGIVLFPLAIYLPEFWQSTWLICTYCLVGFMAAIFMVFLNPLVMASTTEAERNDVFSYQMAFMPLGGFFGSSFGGFFTDYFNVVYALPLTAPEPYVYTMLIGSSMMVVGVVAVFYLRPVDALTQGPEKRGSSHSSKDQDPFPLKIILLISIVITFRIAGEMSVRNFANVYLDTDLSVSPARISYIYSIAQLFAIPAPLIAPRLMNRFGRGQIFNWATMGVAGCVVAISMAQNWIAVAFTYVILLALAQLARPAITIISMQSVTPRWRPSMSSSNIVAIGLSGFGVTPLLWTMLDFLRNASAPSIFHS